VLIELHSLGVRADALRANIDSKSAISLQREPVDPKFQVEGVAPTNHSFFSETKLNSLLYGIKNLHRSFFCFVTIYACDKQTDRQTDGRTGSFLIAIPRLHYRGKNLYFNVSITSRELQTSRLGLVSGSVSSFYVSCPSLGAGPAQIMGRARLQSHSPEGTCCLE